MPPGLFLWIFVATLGIAALVWVAMVIRLVRTGPPIERSVEGPLRRVLGIELVWTLVPAAVALALTISVLRLPGR